MDGPENTSELHLSLVIGTPRHSADMHHTSTTFGGTADLIATIGDAILSDEVKKSRGASSPIRAELQTNFNSSYGQNFVLRVHGEELCNKLNDVGRTTFCEIVNYFVFETLFLETSSLSARAQAMVNELGEKHDDLLAKLRSPLKRMHKVSEIYSYNLVLNHRVHGETRQILTLDEDTASYLNPVKSPEGDEEYRVAISRFNHLTGNGRLFIGSDLETTAFGFHSNIKLVPPSMKKAVATNLNENSTAENSEWSYISILARKLVLRNNQTVKLLITGIIDE